MKLIVFIEKLLHLEISKTLENSIDVITFSTGLEVKRTIIILKTKLSTFSEEKKNSNINSSKDIGDFLIEIFTNYLDIFYENHCFTG